MIKLIKKYFELGIEKLQIEKEVLEQMKYNNVIYEKTLYNSIDWHNFKVLQQRIVNEENLINLTSKTILDEQDNVYLNILKRLENKI